MSDFNYDYNKEIEELKNMIMYLDDQKNVHDLLSLQSEVNKQFANLIQMKISHDYELVQEKVDDIADGLFYEYFME
jgi:hypothetical protein